MTYSRVCMYVCMCMCLYAYVYMCMCLYAYVFVCVYVYMCMCLYVCVCNSRGRILVWSGKCQSKQKVVWSSADIDQLFYITCTLEVRSYVNSTSMEATNQLLAS